MLRVATVLAAVRIGVALPHLSQGNAEGVTACPFSGGKTVKVSFADHAKAAKAKATSADLIGDGHEEIAAALNGRLREMADQTPCEAMTESELDDVFRALWCHRNEELAAHYEEGSGRALHFSTLAEYEREWTMQYVEDAASDVRRGDKCAHVLMAYVHHLSEAGRSALHEAHPELRVPTLPVAGDHADANSFSCISGHNNTGADPGRPNNATFPANGPIWPEEVHYYAMGHGAYPFWLGPGGAGGSKGGHLEVSLAPSLRPCVCPSRRQSRPSRLSDSLVHRSGGASRRPQRSSTTRCATWARRATIWLRLRASISSSDPSLPPVHDRFSF